MDLEEEYIEYALQATLSLLAMSSVYMLDFGQRTSYIVLLSFPLLFAYTAYTSSEGFRKSSLISVAALAFFPLGEVFAFFSILLVSVNILVSTLSHGETLRDFYSSVTLPLLISGTLLGIFLFLSVSSDPQMMNTVENRTAELVSEQVATTVEVSGIFSSTRDAQVEVAKSVSKASVAATEGVIFNETQGQLENDDIQALNSAFDTAEEQVPQRVGDRLNRTSQEMRPDFGTISSEVVKNILSSKTALLFIPLVGLVVYGVHPLVGIIVALIGFLLRGLDRKLGE